MLYNRTQSVPAPPPCRRGWTQPRFPDTAQPKKEEHPVIIDRIEEQERYYSVHKDMEQAFAFLAEAPDLEPGRYELENGLFATVSEGDTRPLDTVDMEAHRKYIDLQYCISGGERMSWAHIQELNLVREDPEHDNYFYAGKSTSISIRPGMFFVMFPSDGHKATCHEQFQKHYRKVVVKIPV